MESENSQSHHPESLCRVLDRRWRPLRKWGLTVCWHLKEQSVIFDYLSSQNQQATVVVYFSQQGQQLAVAVCFLYRKQSGAIVCLLCWEQQVVILGFVLYWKCRVVVVDHVRYQTHQELRNSQRTEAKLRHLTLPIFLTLEPYILLPMWLVDHRVRISPR